MVGICPQIPFVLQPVDIGTNLLRRQLFQQAIGGERVQPKLQDTANFAAACRHDAQRVLTGEDRVYQLFLPLPKRRMAKIFFQNRELIHGIHLSHPLAAYDRSNMFPTSLLTIKR